MHDKGREDLKKILERSGLRCDCGEKVYEAGTGLIEDDLNYNKYFESLECPKCHKLFNL